MFVYCQKVEEGDLRIKEKDLVYITLHKSFIEPVSFPFCSKSIALFSMRIIIYRIYEMTDGT